MQLTADLTKRPVERAENREMSTLGVTFMAGLSGGVWGSLDELSQLRKVETVFAPQTKYLDHYILEFVSWQKAIDRCLRWYPLN